GRGLSLAINGDVVSTGLITKVPEGAEISIVPQISGGVS
ncbi:MAG: MoaD/ThiS family protein, partial [Chloroflexi bacterium]|nr:MoaD/ThiS family protein [Chloroflexota bacterium]